MRDVTIRFSNGQCVPLSSILETLESRAKHLSRFRGNNGDVQCLCHREGIPMGVGLRTTPNQTYFLYPLHRSDPPRHAFDCPHRIASETEGLGDGAKPVVQVINGKININLSAPSWRGRATGAGDAETEEPADKERAANPPNRGKLLSLLEVLWAHAELNVWRPYFEGHRHYATVRYRVLEAAGDMTIKRQPLSPRLYFPQPYTGDDDSEDRAYQAFVNALRVDGNGRQWYGHVMGVLREVRQAETGGFCIYLAHSHRAFWLEDAKAWERLSKRWGLEPGPVMENQGDSIVVMRVMTRAGRHGAWLSVEDMAVMMISDRRRWIPVDSAPERELALRLATNRRFFRKPMSVEYEAGEIVPDFVLEDRADRMHLEVLGRMNDPDYRQQVEAKRAIYQEREQAVWWWETDAGDMPSIPPALIKTRNNGEKAGKTAVTTGSDPDPMAVSKPPKTPEQKPMDSHAEGVTS
jgi:hypothetical protein